MNKNGLENRIKELELELRNLKSDVIGGKQIETKLAELHQFNSQIIDSIQEGIIVYDTNLRHTIWNPFMEKLSGIPAAQVLGKYPTEVFPFLEDVGVIKSLKRALNGESIDAIDFPFNIPDSEKSGWATDKNVPLRNVNGEIIGVIGTVHDITERKRVEQEIKENESSLRDAQKIAKMSSWEWDMVTHKINWSESYLTIPAYKSTKVKPSFELFRSRIYPDDVHIFDEMYAKVMKDKTPLSFEIRLMHPDGTIKWIQNNLSPVIEDDKLVKLKGVIIDIDDLKQSDLALKESESSLRESQKLAKMGSWTLNVIDQTTEWSENCFIIYGYKPFEFIPTFEHFKNRVHPDDWNIVEKNMDFVFKNKVHTISEMRIILPDGTIKWFQNNVVPILQNDKVVKLIGINLDITESKLAELVLKENRNKLLQLNADKDRFISILGHDLKNPFNNLLGLSEVLIEDIHKLNTDQVENIANDINKSARTIYKLLEDILMWARTQQGKIPFKPQILNFRDIYKNILEILKPNVDAKNIAINYSSVDHINVFADIDMLKAVLRNLMSNAIKFTNYGGAININAEQKDSNVTISVSDNGIGIAHDELIKLFDISKVITTKGTAKETGTGLGLLLCKEFVEKHGGKIWVESEVGKGSDFKFTLPHYSEPKEINVVENIVSGIAEDSQIKNLKILITDDDKASRKFLGFSVKLYAKEILYAQNGFEAVLACQDNPDIDLILMDIKMPEMDGFEATRQIRQFNKEVIIIMQTAYESSGEREKAEEAECNDFISKPINKTILIKLIKRHISK
jgi:PAS domain S-box-containing protein